METEQAERLQEQLKKLERRQRRERMQMYGLGAGALQVFGAVARGEGVGPAQIADELGMASSNVASALGELERVGLVVRQRDPRDGRRVMVSLTERGSAEFVRYRAHRSAWLQVAANASLNAAEQAIVLAAGPLLERVSMWQSDEQ